ncbi:unnamed protein product, partial [Brassica napus]
MAVMLAQVIRRTCGKRFTDKAYKKISLLLDPSCLDLCLIHVGEVTVVGAKGNLGRFINNCRLTEKYATLLLLLVCFDKSILMKACHTYGCESDCSVILNFGGDVFSLWSCKSGIATAFFSESNASLARQLAELLQEANQEVPDWLTRYASRASFGGGKKRSGGQTGGNVELSSHASQVVPLGFLVDSQAQELVQNSHSSFLHEICGRQTDHVCA